MFSIDDFRQRYLNGMSRELSHWCAPANGFDDKVVWVNRAEFHDLCSQDSDIYTTKKVHGISIIVMPLVLAER